MQFQVHSMSKHLEIFQERVKRDVSVYYLEGDKVKKLEDCRLIHLDEQGATFEDKVKIGKNRIKFVPNFRLVLIEQELV